MTNEVTEQFVKVPFIKKRSLISNKSIYLLISHKIFLTGCTRKYLLWSLRGGN